MAKHDRSAMAIWMEADEAATTACCAGWPEDKVPGHQIMELIDVPLSPTVNKIRTKVSIDS
ncbi:MAG: hypothetical protein EOR12_03525 [Mesorhizobium sp.]|nr:hypothetical protein EN750_01305 [Mesorhizobium sp. M7A.F.Ca.ET.027.03.2.1]RWO88127.1 MAG: hypothetical protein EOQ96_07790 [Mesorhizobium sp.]RWP92625.1 MAG: hypothetical protein EOR12_03525 [Mesorhizobium sp.]TIN03818.1 MAG: hypothetical protein E5Y34_00835 [Mesorhizobium sp.]